MRVIRLAGATLATLMLTTLLPPTRAAAQVTASIAAVTAGRALLPEKAGCWGCRNSSVGGVCSGGIVPGYWNCGASGGNPCAPTSPGCGAGAMLPLDPDGASQYVSRGEASGLQQELAATGPEFRNCEGIIVARTQLAAQIDAARHRTATLTL